MYQTNTLQRVMHPSPSPDTIEITPLDRKKIRCGYCTSSKKKCIKKGFGSCENCLKRSKLCSLFTTNVDELQLLPLAGQTSINPHHVDVATVIHPSRSNQDSHTISFSHASIEARFRSSIEATADYSNDICQLLRALENARNDTSRLRDQNIELQSNLEAECERNAIAKDELCRMAAEHELIVETSKRDKERVSELQRKLDEVTRAIEPLTMFVKHLSS